MIPSVWYYSYSKATLSSPYKSDYKECQFPFSFIRNLFINFNYIHWFLVHFNLWYYSFGMPKWFAWLIKNDGRASPHFLSLSKEADSHELHVSDLYIDQTIWYANKYQIMPRGVLWEIKLVLALVSRGNLLRCALYS